MQNSGRTRLTVEEALQKLIAGNERFVASRQKHPRQSPEHRAALLEGQNPFTAILACSDSRVAPEVVFDQGLGDLFVIRTAGQVVDDAVMGSIEFAAARLEVPLIVVLGHSMCGMIKACAERIEVTGSLTRMVWEVQAAVDRAKDQGGDLVDNAARANARMIAEKLISSGSVLPELVKKGSLRILPAFYPMDTGRVEWFA